jgi:hypothetical protein
MAHGLPDSFQVRLPFWYVVHRGTAEVSAPGPADTTTLGVSIGHILLKLRWGDGTALAMFTDESRANDFADATGLAGLLPVKVATTTQFHELLVRLATDTTHVGFDPPPPGTARGMAAVVPVAELLATLRSVEDVE